MSFINNINTDVLILQDILIGSLFMYLGIRSAYRKWHHSEAATQPIYYYTKALKSKIVMNVLIIIFYTCAFIYLILVNKDHFMDMMKYMLPFAIIALVLECDLLLFQYTRGISSKMNIHGITWICLTVCSFLTAIAYLVLSNRSENDRLADLFICIIQILLFMLRAGIQLAFPQDKERLGYTDLEENLLSSNRSLITDARLYSKGGSDNSMSSSLLGDRPKKALKGFTIAIKSAKKINDEYQFQINVKSSAKSHKVLKTYSEFKELHELLRDNIIESNKIIECPKLGSLTESSIPQAIMQLQKYIDNILYTFDPVPDSALNFLKIIRDADSRPEPTFGRWFSKKKALRVSEVGINLSATLGTTDNQNPKTQEDERNDLVMSVDLELEFCSYITVTLIDSRIPAGSRYYEYTFRLALSDNPEDNWYITKRYREFNQLVDLLQQKKIKPPKLPPARIMQSKQVVEERKIGLTHFLQVLLNEEIYLRCEEVTRFALISENLQKQFLQSTEKMDFSNWWVRVIENRIKILSNNIAVTEFVILVDTGVPDENHTNQYKIYKRMIDFEDLYSALVVRFGKDLLPQLPAKFNSFFSQTSVEHRMNGLESFLNELFKVSNIEDCFAFRKFLNAPLSDLPRRISKASAEKVEKIEKTQKTEDVLYYNDQNEKDGHGFRLSLESPSEKFLTIHQLRHKDPEFR